MNESSDYQGRNHGPPLPYDVIVFFHVNPYNSFRLSIVERAFVMAWYPRSVAKTVQENL